MKYQVMLLVALFATLAFCDQCTISNQNKVDCGYLGITQQQCETKSCCWQEEDSSYLSFLPHSFSNFINGLFGIKTGYSSSSTPWCYYSSDVCTDFNLSSDDVGFTQEWYEGMYDNFMENINVVNNGAVCAAPDTNTPGGSYYYHWMRDAALSMRTYMQLNDYNYNTINYDMNKYLQWVSAVQNDTDPNGISILVEPKFVISTQQAYSQGWCRPQTDGPGLRSGTLIQWAQVLQKEGKPVSDQLWTAIQTDLGWVNSNWQSNGCDLWEEIQSTDFFWNRMAFYQALTWGATLATSLGNKSLASTWTNTAATIKPTILAHWNGSYIYESTNRLQDSSVIHALTDLNEGLFSLNGQEVTATINSYNQMFCEEYPLNRSDNAANIPGVLYGRYKGDTYAGGNPWQLLTASLAEAFYEGASVTLSSKKAVFEESEIAHFRKIFKNLPDKVTPKHLASAQYQAGNAVMYRIWTHVKSTSNYVLTEQIDKNTGAQISASNLTWSYANVLRVLHYYVFNSSYQSQFKSISE